MFSQERCILIIILIWQTILGAGASAEVYQSLPAHGSEEPTILCRTNSECQPGYTCTGATRGTCDCDPEKTCITPRDCGLDGPSACSTDSSNPSLGFRCAGCKKIECRDMRHTECANIIRICNGGRIGECVKEENLGCTASTDCQPGYTCVGSTAGSCTCDPSKNCMHDSDCGPIRIDGACRYNSAKGGNFCNNCPSIKCDPYVDPRYQCKNPQQLCSGVGGGVCMKLEELVEIFQD